MQEVWAERADAAEGAIASRHLRRLWGLPRTALGVVAWPAVRRERMFQPWHYWWQAHLLDTAVDALKRDPTPKRRRRVAKIARTVRIRNVGAWTNNYYDDMAWLGLSLERAQRLFALDNRTAVRALESQLFDSWAPQDGGGIPWCKGSDFYNTPANGPAAIMLARTGKLWRAQAAADWIDETLRDGESGLIFDGIRRNGTIERAIYSYCQGVTLGLETELSTRLGEPRHRERVHSLVNSVYDGLTDHGVITGGGGGDGGLFNAILARYLAFVVVNLSWESNEDIRAKEIAAQIVLASAQAAWNNRLEVEGLPLFGHDWTRDATLPSLSGDLATFAAGSVRSSSVPERDLSVQIGGWMLMEAAYVVSAAGYPRGR